MPEAVDACEAHLAGASNDPAFAEFIAKTVNGERTAAKRRHQAVEAKAADIDGGDWRDEFATQLLQAKKI